MVWDGSLSFAVPKKKHREQFVDHNNNIYQSWYGMVWYGTKNNHKLHIHILEMPEYLKENYCPFSSVLFIVIY